MAFWLPNIIQPTQNELRLCLVSGKYQGKKEKKNIKKNDFFHIWFHYNFFFLKIKYN